MALIDDFKANLIGGGARANQFRVTITPPSAYPFLPIAAPGKLEPAPPRLSPVVLPPLK